MTPEQRRAALLDERMDAERARRRRARPIPETGVRRPEWPDPLGIGLVVVTMTDLEVLTGLGWEVVPGAGP